MDDAYLNQKLKEKKQSSLRFPFHNHSRHEKAKHSVTILSFQITTSH